MVLRSFLIMYLLYCCTTMNEPLRPPLENDAFEQALVQLKNSRPELFEPVNKSCVNIKKSTYDSGKQVINTVALTSAFVRIYAAHRKIDEPDDTQWYDKTITFISPRLITRIARQSIFFKESIEIALETIVLKTAAKLILYCATKDGMDAFKDIIQYFKSWFLFTKVTS